MAFTPNSDPLREDLDEDPRASDFSRLLFSDGCEVGRLDDESLTLALAAIKRAIDAVLDIEVCLGGWHATPAWAAVDIRPLTKLRLAIAKELDHRRGVSPAAKEGDG